jgi:hypothetical protein
VAAAVLVVGVEEGLDLSCPLEPVTHLLVEAGQFFS